jgi:hypothetical protein
LTLIEVMIAMCVLTVGIMGAMSALMSISTLETANHDDLIAINIARQKLSEIEAQPFDTLFFFYGPNGSQSTFPVSPLGDGVGMIVFPTNAAGNLDETITDVSMGMPADLDGDGNASNTNVSTTYKLLPMRITIMWNRSVGIRTLNLNTMLAKTK